eukprot:GHRQ01012413.1.p3 GENE.GHRQ01012413.1~~GHRQ01012413.1.p3  ORF type:complete len:115 (+),score=38.02 GHRQ01012413.1:948-1292(+)
MASSWCMVVHGGACLTGTVLLGRRCQHCSLQGPIASAIRRREKYWAAAVLPAAAATCSVAQHGSMCSGGTPAAGNHQQGSASNRQAASDVHRLAQSCHASCPQLRQAARLSNSS